MVVSQTLSKPFLTIRGGLIRYIEGMSEGKMASKTTLYAKLRLQATRFQCRRRQKCGFESVKVAAITFLNFFEILRKRVNKNAIKVVYMGGSSSKFTISENWSSNSASPLHSRISLGFLGLQLKSSTQLQQQQFDCFEPP